MPYEYSPFGGKYWVSLGDTSIQGSYRARRNQRKRRKLAS